MMTKLTQSLLALSITLALTACIGDKAQTETKNEANPAETATVNTSELDEKQEIIINNGAEPESLDPHKVNGTGEANLIRQMLVGLTSTDADGKTVPGVAESWTVSEDGKTWTFKLRQSLWSNGEPVTAHDFVYSFQRVIDPKTAAPRASYIADAKIINAAEILEGKKDPSTLGVKAVDDYTFEISLSQPVPYLADALIHTTVRPVHKATVEQFGDKWTDPANIVVNGPYKISNWTVNERIEMTRNDKYFDNGNTTINKVTFLSIVDNSAALNRYLAGELDLAGVPETLFAKMKAERPDELRVAPLLCTYYFEPNKSKPPFDNADVRRALSLALDRETITDKILDMGQTPAYQFAPPFMSGMGVVDPEWRSWEKSKRIEEAKKLLTGAGYSDTNPLKFELLYNTSESQKTIATATAALWKEALGKMVDITLANQEWKTYLDTRRQGNFQMMRSMWCPVYNEPSAILNVLRSNNSSNAGKYSNPEFDQAMDATLQAKDSAERQALYQKAEAILSKDDANILVFHTVRVSMAKPYILNYSMNDPTASLQVKDMKIAKH